MNPRFYLLLVGALLFSSVGFSQTWQRTYGGINTDVNANCATSDGGFLFASSKKTDTYYGYTDIYLLKVNAFGDSLWSQMIGGPSTDMPYAMIQTSAGDILIVGQTYSFSSAYNPDVYVV